MKKLALLSLALMLTLSITVSPALADVVNYTAVTPENSSINHTMELTESPFNLDYTITYSFAAGTPTVKSPDGLNASDVISGTPSIASVSYGPDDNFATAAGHKITKTAAVDWSGVSFKEPGVYYWEITKTADDGGAPLTLSNNNEKTYLFALVTDVNGVLTAAATGLSTTNELTAKVDMQDQYPATAVDLSVGKTVTGTQGSKEQYFKYDIQITPAGSATRNYQISGFDPATTVNASPYNTGAMQPTNPVSLTGNSQSKITVWLRHGQTFKIEDLPYGTSYTITESANDGYDTPTTVVTGDNTNSAANDIAKGTGVTVTDASLTADTTVQYTNNKDAVVPTGISLSAGAALMGILMAIGLLALTSVFKRKGAVK